MDLVALESTGLTKTLRQTCVDHHHKPYSLHVGVESPAHPEGGVINRCVSSWIRTEPGCRSISEGASVKEQWGRRSEWEEMSGAGFRPHMTAHRDGEWLQHSSTPTPTLSSPRTNEAIWQMDLEISPQGLMSFTAAAAFTVRHSAQKESKPAGDVKDDNHRCCCCSHSFEILTSFKWSPMVIYYKVY